MPQPCKNYYQHISKTLWSFRLNYYRQILATYLKVLVIAMLLLWYQGKVFYHFLLKDK